MTANSYPNTENIAANRSREPARLSVTATRELRTSYDCSQELASVFHIFDKLCSHIGRTSRLAAV